MAIEDKTARQNSETRMVTGFRGFKGLYSVAGVPHLGWTWLGVEDEGVAAEVCDMCGQEEIRFVHVMSHPDYFGEARVGCVCAENLSGDYAGPRRGEARAKNRARRKAKWLTRRWVETATPGNERLRAQGHEMFVYRSGNGWKCRFDEKWGKKVFATKEAAKIALFMEYERAITSPLR